MFGLNDYELIYLIIQNNKEAERVMLEKYKLLVWKNVSLIFDNYVPTGVEKDDLFQEGSIALFDSFRSFDPELNVPFFAFANLCIERKMISYIRRFNSLSNKQFYNSVPLDAFVSEEVSVYNADIISDDMEEVSPLIKYNEEVGNIYLYSDSINEFEKNVLVLQIAGFSYSETASRLKCSVKKIDNTLQKVKKLLN